MMMTIALPVAMQNLLSTTGSMVDTIMLGRLGETTVGAVGLCAQFTSLMFSGYWGFIGGGMLFIAQFWGEGNHDGIRKSYGIMLAFVAMTATAATYLALCKPMWVMQLYTNSEPIQKIGVEYLSLVGFSYVFQVLAVAMSALLRSVERVKIPLAGAIAAVITNCVCNYILIFGKLGLPPLGILGGGLANSFANLFTMLTAITLFLCVKQSEYPTREHRRFHWEFVKKLVFFGAPAGLQTFIRNAAFAIVVMMIGNLGDEALAATSIALTINMLGNMPMIGLLDATSVITGQYIGRRKLNVANRIAGRSLRLLFVWMLTASLFYIFAPELLIRLFSSHNASSTGMNFEQVTANVISILHWAVIFNLLDGTRFITMGSLRGAGDTRIPLLIGMATSWLIQIPGTILLVYVIHATVSEVWMLITFYIFIDAALMLWRRGTGAWRRIKVIELPAAGGDGDEKSEAAVC